MKRHKLTKGKRREKSKPNPSGESEMGGADLVLRKRKRARVTAPPRLRSPIFGYL